MAVSKSLRFVSIHAPRTGRDVRQSKRQVRILRFNPRAPHGARRCGAPFHRMYEGGFNPRAPHGARRDTKHFLPRLERFQSTRPARGATSISGFIFVSCACFNPRAPHGARRASGLRCTPAAGFNPRAPHGARRLHRAPSCSSHGFNPRAPHGARLMRVSSASAQLRFQSTRPARGATSASSDCVVSNLTFQSTRPARGATNGKCYGLIGGVVSIHAPRTGRDVMLPFLCCLRVEFQSTRPARGATAVARSTGHVHGVSIHAPRTGRDGATEQSARHRERFNPRAPHGARQAGFAGDSCAAEVSIHAPRTGRDPISCPVCAWMAPFQSTRPARGATTLEGQAETGTQRFNPRAPHGARPEIDVWSMERIWVSIHAPRTGRDQVSDAALLAAQVFQSTRPARGATRRRGVGHSPMLGFNPRAPHGARHRSCRCTQAIGPFQSTRPARGATGLCRRLWQPRTCFNPRAGEYEGDLAIQFQSTRPARGATPRRIGNGVVIGAFQSTRPARGATRWRL